jgi:L-malate glycosyltransferase
VNRADIDMRRPVTILHILPHAGGGVGTVLRAILASEATQSSPYKHTVATLEYLNDPTKNHCERYAIPWIENAADNHAKELNQLLKKSDIVLVHWWNHPLLMRFLSLGLPSTRLLLWSHVNGYYPPQFFFPALFDFPDLFVFSSETSYLTPTVRKLSGDYHLKLRVIRSISGIPAGTKKSTKKTKAFQAGYIGTVEPAKMHSEFLSMCAKAGIPSPIVVVGGPGHEELRKKAVDLDISAYFNILGPVSDPLPIFKQLHALAYPLAPFHYGTGEQVLIEAMAYGAVPVVLANPPEKAIIRQGETGIITESAEEFAAALRMLMENPAEQERLARGGHCFVMDQCGIEHSTKAFHALFEEILSFPKSTRKLRLQTIKGVDYGSPLHLFLNAVEDFGYPQNDYRIFNSGFADGLLSKTRGSSFHYLNMLGHDPQLEALCHKLIANGN